MTLGKRPHIKTRDRYFKQPDARQVWVNVFTKNKKQRTTIVTVEQKNEKEI